MTFEDLYLILVAAAPSLTAIIGIIVSVLKLIKEGKHTNQEVINKFEEVRQEIFNTKEYEDIKTQLAVAHQENIELKRIMYELLTKIDHISRK